MTSKHSMTLLHSATPYLWVGMHNGSEVACAGSSRLCAKQISRLGLCMMAAHTPRGHHWRRLRDVGGRLMEAADGYFDGQRESAQDPCACQRRAATPRMPREPHSPEVALPCWHG